MRRLDPAKLKRAARKRGTNERNVTGLKLWWVRGLKGYMLTPYARKEKKRRRAADRIAKQSRKANR